MQLANMCAKSRERLLSLRALDIAEAGSVSLNILYANKWDVDVTEVFVESHASGEVALVEMTENFETDFGWKDLEE